MSVKPKGCTAQSEFMREFLGDFTPSTRMAELHRRLEEHYMATENAPSHIAANSYRQFLSWANGAGYTKEEISKAKPVARQ